MATKRPEMDPETAKELFEVGAMFVFLNVPPRTEFGIDCNSWNTGEKFKGVKMIPPGIHFVFYCAVGSLGDRAPRTGFFYNFKSKEMVIKRYDQSREEMIDVGEGAEMDVNRQELDGFLGAYPYETYKKWISMSNHINDAILKKIVPFNGRIPAVTEMRGEEYRSSRLDRHSLVAHSEPPKSIEEAEKLLPIMHENPEASIRYSAIPKRKFPDGLTPAEITRYCLDMTFSLDSMIQGEYQNEERLILAELQLCFVCFLLGQNYESFEQWKNLIYMLCHSEEAMIQRSDLYTNFISVMYYQLKEIPEDFFVDIVSRNNFLTSTLQVLFATMLQNDSIDVRLREKATKFKNHLTQRFKWDFESEPDEFAPVVVVETD